MTVTRNLYLALVLIAVTNITLRYVTARLLKLDVGVAVLNILVYIVFIY
jgi:hypothetical protein